MGEKKFIENMTFQNERALFALHDAFVAGCRFAGDEDGESPLKETRNIEVHDCIFRLRYPLWHSENCKISRIQMSDTCRAPFWYCRNLEIAGSTIGGVKALRECENVIIDDTDIYSAEFGWMLRNAEISEIRIQSEYAFMRGENINVRDMDLDGRFSFHYAKNCLIDDSRLDTSDAFWHSDGITIKNSTINGEFFGWYSHGITLINCKIVGTQPLCYARDVQLIDCELVGAYGAFEHSTVEADVTGKIESVYNPMGGHITADEIGKVITDEHARGFADIKTRRSQW